MNSKDIKKARKHLIEDPLIGHIVQHHEPLILNASGNVFCELVKNIVYQQISYKAADTIFNRFVDLVQKEKYQPEDILKFDFDTLKSVGLSRQKTNYILNISRHFYDKDLFDKDWSLDSDEEIIKELTTIKGVGIWTAKMILIFELKRPDVWPYEDLAIQHVVKELSQIQVEKKQLNRELVKIAEPWRPFRTIAGLYLWSYRRSQYEKDRAD